MRPALLMTLVCTASLLALFGIFALASTDAAREVSEARAVDSSPLMTFEILHARGAIAHTGG